MPAPSTSKARSTPSRRRPQQRSKNTLFTPVASSFRVARPALIAGVGTGPGVRWDRLGRVAMLLVLAALLYLYLSAGIRMLSTWRQARTDSSAVVAMEREHRLLVRQHEALGTRGTLEAEARRLGMINRGEQQYIISGLPND